MSDQLIVHSILKGKDDCYWKAFSCRNAMKLVTEDHNQFHNILRLFDVLPNFPFTTCETMGNYYLKRWYIRLFSRVAERFKT